MTLEAAVAAEDSGVDDAERLKHRLYLAWREEHVTHVLLVGDAEVMPVRYMVLDRVTEPAFDTAFYPSDLYYADVARADGSFEAWNAQREGHHATYFGEVHGEHHKGDAINFDGIDYLPELAVGRWPVSDAKELAHVVSKSLAHLPAEKPKAALLYTSGWVDARPTLRGVAASVAPRVTVDTWFEGDAERTPDGARTLAALRAGVDLVVHAGHGHPHGFDRGLQLGDLAALGDVPRRPIVLSAGCSTAYFAPLPPYEAYVDRAGVAHAGTNGGEVFTAPPPAPAVLQPTPHEGFGEQLVVGSPGGAVAYFGCNTGSQPCGLTLVGELATRVGAGDDLGTAWVGAVRAYHRRENLATLTPTESWYPPSIFFQGMKFMLFGDPTLRLVR